MMETVKSFICLLVMVTIIDKSCGYMYKRSCPRVSDIQTSDVATHFNLTKFQGIWYKVAYHDKYQLGHCRCQRANKVYKPEERELYDSFSFYCGNRTFVDVMYFKITDVTGYFEGHWHITPIVLYDTVVALQVDKDGNYDWVVEFQCNAIIRRIVFVGINFYHRRNNVTTAELDGMFKVARQQGLGEYMDYGPKVTIVDHRNCVYPDTAPPEFNLAVIDGKYVL